MTTFAAAPSTEQSRSISSAQPLLSLDELKQRLANVTFHDQGLSPGHTTLNAGLLNWNNDPGEVQTAWMLRDRIDATQERIDPYAHAAKALKVFGVNIGAERLRSLAQGRSLEALADALGGPKNHVTAELLSGLLVDRVNPLERAVELLGQRGIKVTVEELRATVERHAAPVIQVVGIPDWTPVFPGAIALFRYESSLEIGSKSEAGVWSYRGEDLSGPEEFLERLATERILLSVEDRSVIFGNSLSTNLHFVDIGPQVTVEQGIARSREMAKEAQGDFKILLVTDQIAVYQSDTAVRSDSNPSIKKIGSMAGLGVWIDKHAALSDPDQFVAALASRGMTVSVADLCTACEHSSGPTMLFVDFGSEASIQKHAAHALKLAEGLPVSVNLAFVADQGVTILSHGQDSWYWRVERALKKAP